MTAGEERATLLLAVVLVFDREDASRFVAEFLPASAQDLFDAAMADPRWRAASSRMDRAVVLALLLVEERDLRTAFDADVRSGRLGLGAGPEGPTDAEVRAVAERMPRPARATPSRPRSGPSHRPSGPSRWPGGQGGRGKSAVGSGDDRFSDDLDRMVDGGRWRDGGGQQPDREPISWGEDEQSMDVPFQDAGFVPDDAPHADPVPADAPQADPVPADAPQADPVPAADGDAGSSPDATVEVYSWLNARLDDGGEPLRVGTGYALTVAYDDHARPHAEAHPTVFTVHADESDIEVQVDLVSDDFDVPPDAGTLTVDLRGRSAAPAIFAVTPRHPGASRLAVIVSRQGNFVQRMDLVYDVGGVRDVASTGFGRPIGAAGVLEPREASLQFTQKDGHYQVVAPAVSKAFVDIHVDPDTLHRAADKLRAVLLDWVRRPEVAGGLTISEADGKALLFDLAKRGFQLYDGIFHGPHVSDELRAIGTWMRETLAGGVTVLQVIADDFPVPWPLMYLAERFDPRDLSWDRFLGVEHIVEHLPFVRQETAPAPPVISSTPALSVRVVYNTDLDGQIDPAPVTAQRKYWAGRGVTVVETTTLDDFVTEALAPDSADQLLYLYCHAEDGDDDPELTRIILTGDQSVTLEDLRLYYPTADRLAAKPIVFLNACETAQLSPRFYDSFVTYFQDKGARGVIGTECKTPGVFASAFAQSFFEELFAGTPLGESVLATRQLFLREHNNPLGLIYGVYCDPDIVVTPALPVRRA